MIDEANPLSLGQCWKEEISNAKAWLAKWHESGREILKRLKDDREENASDQRVNLATADYLARRSVLYGRTPQAMVDRRWKDPADDIARVAGEMLSRHLNDDITSGDDGYARALGYVLEDRLTVGMGQARVRYEVETDGVPQEDNADDSMGDAGQDGIRADLPGGNEPVPSVDSMGSDPRLRLAPAVPPISLGAAHFLGLADGSATAVGGGTMAAGQTVSPDGGLPPAGLDGAGDAQPTLRKVSEACKVDYTFWEDFLWSPCRYWEVARWVGFKAEMSRKALIKRFDSKRFPTVRVEGSAVPLDTAKPKEGPEARAERAWDRATVWEIWDKEERQVVWCTENGTVLDVQKDPLGLKGFFPCPRPLFSLVFTDELIPRPDYVLAQDLYVALDELSTRMHLLRSALRVVGVYDASNKAMLESLLDPINTMENRMVPVESWAALGEKGGLPGVVDWFPIQSVASTLTALSAEYEALKLRLYEVTGTPDIMRGQGSAIQTTAQEQRIKAQFGSARLQNVQDEFARFATDLQALKAEVIALHFEPEEIVRASNMDATADKDLAPQAALFLKDRAEQFRVKVQPEALALSDFAQVKEERMEVVEALGAFIQAVTPLLQQMPAAGPAIMEILKWLVSSLRGSSEIEGVLDRALAMAQQAAQAPQGEQAPPPPDPKLVLAQFNAQAKERQIQLEAEVRQKEIVTQTAADTRREVVQREQNVLETLQEALIQRMIERGWTPPGGIGPLPSAAPPAPVVPTVPPVMSQPPTPPVV
jgi:hypothetical protein